MKKKQKTSKTNYSLIQKIKEFKDKLCLDLILSNGHSKYGNSNLFFIEFVLNLLGFKTIDSKIDYLLDLQEKDLLIKFYQSLGIKNFHRKSIDLNHIPAKSTFSEYKNTIQLNSPSLLLVNVRAAKVKEIIEKESLIHIAIDGKDIRNTGSTKHAGNIKSIHLYGHNLLFHNEFTNNENNWIKDNLQSTIALIKEQINKPLLFTGDGIYNNAVTRKIFNELGVYYLLPFKKKSKIKEEIFVNTKKVRNGKDVRISGSQIALYEWTLYKIKQNKENIQHYLHIDKYLIDNRKRNKHESYIEKPVVYIQQKYLTNHPDPNIDYFKHKIDHWQVETYHHFKDTIFEEDKQHKSRENAKIYATLNDIVAFFYKQEKINKTRMKKLQSVFMYELTLLLKFFCRTMLRNI
jgi:hypothetical protein